MPNCRNVLENGTCSVSNCPFEHNITVCEPCGRVFNNVHGFKAHVLGKRHRVDSSNGGVLSCPLCDVNLFGSIGWQNHLKTKSHLSKATARGIVDVDPEPGRTKGGVQYCEFCGTVVLRRHWENHVNTSRHKSKVNFGRYRAAIEDSEKDKNGVHIDGDFDFGFVPPHDAVSGKKISATILTMQPISHSVLLSIRLASSQGLAPKRSAFSVALPVSERKIAMTKPLSFTVEITERHIGRYEDRAEFLFEDTQLKKEFIITRSLRGIIGNSAEHQALAPTMPYVPRERTGRKPIRDVVEGIRPPALKSIPYIGKLPMASIPSTLSSILSSSSVAVKLVPMVKRRFMPSTLNADTYSRWFKQLLWTEEYQAELDMEGYDTVANLKRHNKYFYLPVAGLAEKRPSVVTGDLIFVQEKKDSNKWFEGHVHVVRRDEVGLCFHSSFGGVYSPSTKYCVRFKLNRIPVRRQHMAMDTAFNEDRVLFPQVDHILASTIRTPGTFPIRAFNPLISSNPPQLQAVISILTLRPGSSPFVIFGPPGTGKTVTIIEAIKQILSSDPNAKILACAPSNSAVDLMASRLVKTRTSPGLTVDELFRLYAPSRSKDQVPDDLRDFIYSTAEGHLSIPTMARFKRFRVILTTCVSASILQGVGLPRGHFSHIFIDEAGQATEPETFVSIKLMADSKTNIALSGDPKQLGPIIRSGVARQLGLELSYLERLMDRETYDLKKGYGKSVVKLTKNFRSHPAILQYPNERFYANELQACGEPAIINFYNNSQYLPSRKFPIVFHSVSGKDDREASSPSFFNIDEVLQVKAYVQKLKEDRRYRTTDSDIGIIAPYHAQCLRLRATLRNVADGIKIGSVEEFQGQERKVMIISTVRSSREFVSYDLRHTLGFVANPRRFNVAVTRAKALLIIVGDPLVLSLDPLWRSFLNYIYLNHGWAGPDISWDPKAPVDGAAAYDKAIRQANDLDMNSFTMRLENLTLNEVEDEVDANIDRPWRELE